MYYTWICHYKRFISTHDMFDIRIQFAKNIYIYIFVTIHILIFKIEIHSFLDVRYEKNIYIRYIKCDIIFRISLIDVPIGHLTRIYKWDI